MVFNYSCEGIKFNIPTEAMLKDELKQKFAIAKLNLPDFSYGAHLCAQN